MAIGRDVTGAGTVGARGNRLGLPLAPIDLSPSYSGPSADARPRRESGYTWAADPLRRVRRDRRVGAGKKPSADQLHYAHLAGQNVLVWGGLLVFGVLLISKRTNTTAMLRNLARRQVGAG